MADVGETAKNYLVSPDKLYKLTRDPEFQAMYVFRKDRSIVSSDKPEITKLFSDLPIANNTADSLFKNYPKDEAQEYSKLQADTQAIRELLRSPQKADIKALAMHIENVYGGLYDIVRQRIVKEYRGDETKADNMIRAAIAVLASQS